jgi:hypothetical protein
LKIAQKLANIQSKTPALVNIGVTQAFIARTPRNSPFAVNINNYPQFLAEKPDGTALVSVGNSLTLRTGTTVTFSDYPNLGQLPNIDTTGLNFLDNEIIQACVCVGSFNNSNSDIKVHWLGKNALDEQQFWSATKFIGVLNAICQINQNSIATDTDNCKIIEGNQKFTFHDLVKEMTSYSEDARGNIGRSNQIGVLFKRFTTRDNLQAWARNQTGNSSLQFLGGYGADPLLNNPTVRDVANNKDVLKAATTIGSTGRNLVSAYDLVRLISMLGWHLHLKPSSQLPSAQWNSLESVVRAMGNDPARYVDVALETLGVINVISNTVVISKVGFGDEFTYVVLVKLNDQRSSTAKLRTLAMALRTTPTSMVNRDNKLAGAVTEIMRRILTEELA